MIQKKLNGENGQQLRGYFGKIKELVANGEQFPVDFEDVWPLVYSRKDHAIRALTEKCTQGVDYVLLPKKGSKKEGQGGHNRLDYKISVPCLEFIIARQVKAVFEVYRTVFHAATQAATPSIQATSPEHIELNANSYTAYDLLLERNGLSRNPSTAGKRRRKYQGEFVNLNRRWYASAKVEKVISAAKALREAQGVLKFEN